MQKVQWTEKDFAVFTIEGLENRMEGLISTVRPKFEILGNDFSTYFSSCTGNEFFPHIAKHARRKVNPPVDSWVAFAPYKRGYKALPHFQIGLYQSHIFIILCVIYEAPGKVEIAERLLNNLDIFNQLPENFYVSGDHFSPDGILLRDAKDGVIKDLLTRLKEVKKGEFLVGLQIPKDQAIKLSPEEFSNTVEKTFEQLLPIYDVMVK